MKDLKEVLNQNEKKGGLLVNSWSNGLRELMNEIEAIDLGFFGLPITWTNKNKYRHNIK